MSVKPPVRTHSAVHLVEVRLRAEFADSEGAQALALLQGLGVAGLKEARASRLYRIDGALTVAHAQQAARELLCDPVTQDWKLVPPAAAVSNGMSHWRVEVWLKDSVTDPVGETVAAALAEMGLPGPAAVRVGTAFHIVGRCHKVQLEKAVPRGLANPVVHRFTVAETHA